MPARRSTSGTIPGRCSTCVPWKRPAESTPRRPGATSSAKSSCSNDRSSRQSTPRTTAPVLLIDEVDRADQELEAFLLELLSDFQVTVPELGTIRAEHAPIVILTSNRTREIHDALKRRCLYYWIDFPTYNKEYRILSAKVPDAPEKLRVQICGFTQGLREVDLFKPPGMAETLDWAQALLSLGTTELNTESVDDTLGVSQVPGGRRSRARRPGRAIDRAGGPCYSAAIDDAIPTTSRPKTDPEPAHARAGPARGRSTDRQRAVDHVRGIGWRDRLPGPERFLLGRKGNAGQLPGADPNL